MKRLIAWALMLMLVLTGPSCFAETAEATKAPEAELHLLWGIPFGSSMEECIELAQANAGVTLKKVEGKDDELEADLGSFPIFNLPTLKLVMSFDEYGLMKCELMFGGAYTKDVIILEEDKSNAVIDDAVTCYLAVEKLLVRQYGPITRSFMKLKTNLDSQESYVYNIPLESESSCDLDVVRDAARKYPGIAWATDWSNVTLICSMASVDEAYGFLLSLNYEKEVLSGDHLENAPYYMIEKE